MNNEKFNLDLTGNEVTLRYNVFEDYDVNRNMYVIHSGMLRTPLLISKKYFEKKLTHKLQDLMYQIVQDTMNSLKIIRKDFLSEKFVVKLQDEREINPLYKYLTEEELEKYSGDSIPIIVTLNYEFHIKMKLHLLIHNIKKNKKIS